MEYEIEKLVAAYEKHGFIVVGLDFDNTIYPLDDDPRVAQRCQSVRDLIGQIRPKIKVCLWTLANSWTVKYKVSITEDLYGIKLDAVNESVLYVDEGLRKPYFSILLDDNAGLTLAMDMLAEFNELTD